MDDKYLNFRELCLAEHMGTDFQIDCRRRPGSVAIIAPHGGKIERRTSEIAAEIAGDTYSLYCFEGIKRHHNGELHITSSHFDEPECLTLISGCDQVVAIHGCKGDDQVIYLGGLDRALRGAIRGHLDAAGFTTGVHPNLQGTDRDNICNRGRRGCGVQLEISHGLRKALKAAAQPDKAPTSAAFVGAIHAALAEGKR
jgi:phage replication-related protein YjqB (UPF0714/DUF867 family)